MLVISLNYRDHMVFYIAYEKIQQHCISGGGPIYYAFLMISFILPSSAQAPTQLGAELVIFQNNPATHPPDIPEK